jgi:uncharacterized protein (DUF2235 family)
VRDKLDARTNTRRPTNVTKVARAVRPHDDHGVSQVVYWHAGVGTGGPLDSVTGGAFGHGMADNIRDMYRFIVYNHEPGDEIYLFGFSRGAFTVRSLAGFIHFAGLVTKEEDYYVPDLYACYEGERGEGTPEWNHLFKDIKAGKNATRVQDRRARTPPIRFVGVWDTVGALGAPGVIGALSGSKKRHGYHRPGLNPLIQHAAHAVSIDEQRKLFAPTLFERGDWKGSLHQAWFAGVHSDIGGGYDDDSLANHALHWMVGHATSLGLAMDETYLKPFGSDPQIALHDTMSTFYRMMGPWERPIGTLPPGDETIHPSALARFEQQIRGYQPRNLATFLARGK